MRNRVMVSSLIFGSVLGIGGWWITSGNREVPALEPVQEYPEVGSKLFEQVYNHIATHYVDSLPVDSIYRKAVAGLVDELDDPYSAFLPEARMERLQRSISGNYSGIGVRLDERDGWATVINVFPGSPAERGGLLSGDRVTAVESENTQSLTLDEVGRLIRGTPGSKVNVSIQRSGIHDLKLTIERESVGRRSVQRVVMLSRDVGYVDINIFGVSTATELRAALDSLDGMGARGAVVDLRGNPGGLLEQGVAVSELFLDAPSRIVELRGRPGSPAEVIRARQPQWWPKLAVAVLLDANSASASEIVAGALQDNDRAVIVGHTSFGKGSAQTVYPMATGGALRITTSRWYTPLGRSISHPWPSEKENFVDEDDIERDTVRPSYKTAMGRKILGGGGIVPDVFAGDSALPEPVEKFRAALGVKTDRYRDALAAIALSVKQTGSLADPYAPVTRDMVERVYDELVKRDVHIDRQIYDTAAPWIGRTLGYEIVRVAFGADHEFLRRAQDDAVIARAIRLLEGASSPREPFARAGEPDIVIPARIPTLN